VGLRRLPEPFFRTHGSPGKARLGTFPQLLDCGFVAPYIGWPGPRFLIPGPALTHIWAKPGPYLAQIYLPSSGPSLTQPWPIPGPDLLVQIWPRF